MKRATNPDYLRVLSCLLALLTVLALCSNVISCAAQTDDAATANDSGTEADSETETAEGPDQTLDTPEGLNFNNTVFRVLSIDYGTERMMTHFDVEKLNAEPINDAIYERNRVIENLYGVKFETAEQSYEQNYTTLKNQVSAGTHGSEAFDLIMEICRNAYPLALDKMLCDYRRLEYVDIDKEYYFREINRQFAIGGHTFMAFGADCLNVVAQANCILYNKDMAKEYKIPTLYDEVYNSSWTYQRMIDLATSVTADTSGDGVISASDDIIGCIGRNDYIIPAGWISAGELLFVKDEDDLPVYNAEGNTRLIESFGLMLDFFKTDAVSFGGTTDTTDLFKGGHALFMGCGLSFLYLTRDAEIDYGVLPWPKYDVAQDQYYSRLIDGWLNVVPNTCQDTAMTSAILQALAYYSGKTVYKAYLDQSLQAKYIRDPESADMITLILKNVVIDLGDTVWMSDFRAPMSGAFMEKGSGGLASTFASYSKTAQNNVKKVTKFLSKLEAQGY